MAENCDLIVLGSGRGGYHWQRFPCQSISLAAASVSSNVGRSISYPNVRNVVESRHDRSGGTEVILDIVFLLCSYYPADIDRLKRS